MTNAGFGMQASLFGELEPDAPGYQGPYALAPDPDTPDPRIEERQGEIEGELRVALVLRSRNSAEFMEDLAAKEDGIARAHMQAAQVLRDEGSYYESARRYKLGLMRERKAAIYRGEVLQPDRAAAEIAAEDGMQEEAYGLHGERATLQWKEHWSISRSEVRWGFRGSLQGVCHLYMQRDKPDRWRPVVIRLVSNGPYAGNIECDTTFASLVDAQAWAERRIYMEVKGGY